MGGAAGLTVAVMTWDSSHNLIQTEIITDSALIVLGIETSCDETAAAIARIDPTQIGRAPAKVLSHVVLSQIEQHRPHGGVVPELAARAHAEHLPGVVDHTLAEAGIEPAALSAVAATVGPGLIGGVMVGSVYAKGLAAASGVPFLAINHLEGHALSPRLTEPVAFPYLLLLVSGGHCQLLIVHGPGRYTRLGTTLDDAAGEAFDKVAKQLGLPYPGGPLIEQLAQDGDATRFPLPRPYQGAIHCDFSFSGLKSAAGRIIATWPTLPPDQAQAQTKNQAHQDRADLAASLQTAITGALVDRTRRAIGHYRAHIPAGGTLVVAGGVAANQTVRAALESLADLCGLSFAAPPLKYCTDNGAMIAWAGIERLALGQQDRLDVKARPRWPLDELAPPKRGAGVKA